MPQIAIHSEYSLLSSTIKIDELIKKAKNRGFDALGIADYGNMHAAVEFYKKAKKNGIKPIIGCDFVDFILYAKNNIGLHNLYKLSSRFCINNNLKISDISELKEGIICIYKGDNPNQFYNTFSINNFYISSENKNRYKNFEYAYAKDVNYIEKEDFEAYKILNSIKNNINIKDNNIHDNQNYFKNSKEMEIIAKQDEKAYNNTKKIVENCNIDIEFNNYKLPKYDLDYNINSKDYLKSKVYDGLHKKYKIISKEIKARADYELKIINKMGFDDYFLITWDFIKHAKENGIAVGPGRGSAAGSIVSYALNITAICPIEHNLFFERFLNPDRISLPDIDIDFCYERRNEIINYVINKYGVDRVAHIITFGTLGAKAAIRDVGRAMGYDYSYVDKIAKMVPFSIGITINEAIKQNNILKSEYNNDNNIKKLIDMAIKLEGLARHQSTHAAGIIISDIPLQNYIPLTKMENTISTQFTMGILEELGLLKIDFLGLRNISLINNTIKEIKEKYNKNIDFEKLGYKDKFAYKIIQDGHTEGLFQLESRGMKSFMRDLKPKSIQDLTAGISLFRPGPMDFIPKYIENKKNRNKIEYLHPYLEPILKETYGCVVYQEQVMQIAQKLAGFSLESSDSLRRAMSKKKEDDILKEKNNFINGCKINGIKENISQEIFNNMIDFAKYAFNKSHAVCYAMIGYQTAYLKANYPLEFMANLLSTLSSQSSKFDDYIKECARLKITILNPDINKSIGNFKVDSNGIRYGLNSIKNLGKPTIDGIIKARKNGNFKNIYDLISKIDNNLLNKKSFEALILSGAMDSIGSRDYILKNYESIIQSTLIERRTNIEGQVSLFDSILNKPKELWIKIPKELDIDIESIFSILGANYGNIPVIIYKEKTKTIMKAIEKFWIFDYNDIIAKIENILGEGTAKFK